MKDAAQKYEGPEPIDSESTSDQDFYILKLYVAGHTKKSLEAFANLKKMCEEHLCGRYRMRL